MDKTEDLIETLEDLQEEDLPRQVRARVDEMLLVIREEIDIELRVDRLRSILDDLESQDSIPTYVRTQLWNVNAMLEMF